ncbi:MAG: SMI1/KNR4 family protein [Planctomycetota bacterium]|nr:SMI1/KNR4 family protein [Planctomycetota bacterium]
MTANDDNTRESENVDTNVEKQDNKDQESSPKESSSETPLETVSSDAESASSSSNEESDAVGAEAASAEPTSSESSDNAESLALDSDDPSGVPDIDDSELDDDDDIGDMDLMDEGFAEDELPPAFERFVTSLSTNDDGEVEGLEPPATKGDILAAEKRLAFSLPEDFRDFLSYWNGGSVHEVCIYGVGTEDEFDIVEFNKRSHSEDFPKEFIAFASTVVGDIFCFQRDWGDDEDVPVFLYDAENGTAVETAESFLDWLDSLPSMEKDISDAQQPQPMSIEEWESFLSRERAKLRKLSKTPAKDLFMPDPDAIRAELKNKIPVDPRHLKPKT